MAVEARAPQFLTIGHLTRDGCADGSFSVGGTVTFAALTAYRLGLAAAIVTCASELPPAELFSGIALHIRYSTQTTTFVNRYTDGFRTQYLLARGDILSVDDVPANWRNAPIVLLGPLAQELTPDFVTLFPRRSGALLAATPQGWLRRWDADGRVWPTAWHAAEQVLPLLDSLIVSYDDLLPLVDGNRAKADALLARWSMQVALLVATDGRHGATLFRQGTAQRFLAYTCREIDPTGAGDVFAAAFLVHLYWHSNPEQAVNFANCVASFSIEQEGVQGIPTLAMVYARLHI
jgi:sugar/nucleoside kinase (ribokinase family)